MRLLIVTAIATVALFGCSGQPGQSEPKNQASQENNDKLTTADAKELIPEAASIANEDFETLSKTPDPTKIETQTLSLVLFSLNPFEEAKKNPAVLNDFKYLTERFPKPSTIADAMWRSKSKGYASMIQPEFITDCKCNTENGKATGTVTFTADKLYAGTVEFTAHPNNGAWRVEEFRLPNYGVKVVRGEDGAWKKTPLESNPK